MEHSTFAQLALTPNITRALAAEGYRDATPIQLQAIPPLLEGRDILACAQTGTGKTAAFSLPMLQRLSATKTRPIAHSTRALILTPTRELAVQVQQSVEAYAAFLSLRSTVVFGGVSIQPQKRALARGVDVLVATPGRLLDLIAQKQVELGRVEYFVLDEADRMLDMGFIRDVKKIVALLPSSRQTALFSATMPEEIAVFAKQILRDPARVQVTPVSSTAEKIHDHVLFVASEQKQLLLLDLLKERGMDRVIVFTKTKHRANRLSKQLNAKRVSSEAIHGNKTQSARQRALNEFANGKVRVLVATDIVARGIDVDGISHVINFDLPNEPESYVHRIGRTARAGATGTAFSFCGAEELPLLAAIEKVLARPIPVFDEHAQHERSLADRHVNAQRHREIGQSRQKPNGTPAAGRQRRRRRMPRGAAQARASV